MSATISSSDRLPPPSRIRLPPDGAKGSPVRPALCRVVDSRLSTPSRTHSVASTGSPLSKTDAASPEAWAITNGADSSPGSFGSLRSVSGSSESCSPTRVPPPGRLKTVRPSAASRAAALHCW